MTNIERVKRQLESMIPDAYRMEIDNSLVEYGISDMAISMNIDIKFKYAHDIQDIDGNIVETQEAVDCTPDLNLEEIRAASYYSYRRYLIKLKDALNRDSMGIKTMTLEIKDMHKRVEAVDSLLLEVNRYINNIEGMKCLGKVVQFGKRI